MKKPFIIIQFDPEVFKKRVAEMGIDEMRSRSWELLSNGLVAMLDRMDKKPNKKIIIKDTDLI